jgi:hypothetical protein
MTSAAAEPVPGIPELFDPSALSLEWHRVVADAFALGPYPWHTLSDGLLGKTGRTRIPLDVADLSRWGAQAAQAADDGDVLTRRVVGVDHDDAHDKLHAAGAHLVVFRRRALGLAWYSGRVTLEQTLAGDPALAAKVLWFELAHMVHFFGLTPDQERAIFAAFHAGEVTEHGHGSPEDLFGDVDRTGYWHQVGEAWMVAFAGAVAGISPGPDSGGFAHRTTPEVLADVRRILPEPEPPDLAPEPPDLAPEPPDVAPETPELAEPYFGLARSPVFHDEHRGVTADARWATYADAVDAGRRPCRVCRPRP